MTSHGDGWLCENVGASKNKNCPSEMISPQYIIAVQCCSRFCARNSIDTDECDTKDPYYYQFHQNEEFWKYSLKNILCNEFSKDIWILQELFKNSVSKY